jgi:hypothetical protein
VGSWSVGRAWCTDRVDGMRWKAAEYATIMKTSSLFLSGVIMLLGCIVYVSETFMSKFRLEDRDAEQ